MNIQSTATVLNLCSMSICITMRLFGVLARLGPTQPHTKQDLLDSNQIVSRHGGSTRNTFRFHEDFSFLGDLCNFLHEHFNLSHTSASPRILDLIIYNKLHNSRVS